MASRQHAQALGKLGGLARGSRLFSAERSRIAKQGALSRHLSRHATERVDRNFVYLEAVRTLRQAGRHLRAD